MRGVVMVVVVAVVVVVVVVVIKKKTYIDLKEVCDVLIRNSGDVISIFF